MNADRNLLFGILALQNDFIGRDQLVEAMNAWVLAKEKPLGALLVERGALAPDVRAVIDAMLDLHVKRHGGDAARSLAGVGSASSAVGLLRSIADPDLQASLAAVAPPGPNADLAETKYFSAGARSSTGGRFRILRFHRAGGMGQVSVAQDTELPRRVALKEIREERAGDAESRARFLLEAEINGGLEHPGIVPVYGLGSYPDGRPFYAMRFVEGDSLRDAIRAFHERFPRGTAGREGERGIELRGLLRRFLDVCNAMQYAHDRGVLHRDLKPDNIMLGKYGETLVVDWGLAKASGKPEVVAGLDATPALDVRHSASVTPTVAGEAKGTLAYMSPEQAAGRLDLLGPATDVYSLGATLYHLLAGVPPFVRGEVHELLRRVRSGEFPSPRSLDPSIAAPLDAVCLKAMAREPKDRYASCADLARDVERWLADEPVIAAREPWRDRAARWARKRPGTVAAAAAILVTGALGLGLGLYFVNAERGRTAVQRDKAVAAERLAGERLAEVSAAKEKAERQKQVALAVREFLQVKLLGQADAKSQADQLVRAGASPKAAKRNPTIRELLDRAAEELAPDKIERNFPGKAAQQAELLFTVGVTYDRIGSPERAVELLSRAVKLAGDRFSRLDSIAVDYRQRLAVAHRHAGDVKTAAALLERLRADLATGEGVDDSDRLTTTFLLADSLRLAGEPQRALELLEEIRARALGEGALGEEDKLNFLNSLGLAYDDLSKPNRALAIFEQAYAGQCRLRGPDHPESLASLNNIAAILSSQGRLEEAREKYERVHEAFSRLYGPEHPDTLSVLLSLTSALQGAGEIAKAMENAERIGAALERRRFAHEQAPLFMNSIFSNLEAGKRLDRAEYWRRKWVAHLKEKFGPAAEPVARETELLGLNLMLQRKWSEAEPLLRESLKIRTAARPDDWTAFQTRSLLGGALLGAGKRAAAEPFLVEAVAGLRQRAAKIPLLFRTAHLANALERLIELYEATGRKAEAAKLRKELEAL